VERPLAVFFASAASFKPHESLAFVREAGDIVPTHDRAIALPRRRQMRRWLPLVPKKPAGLTDRHRGDVASKRRAAVPDDVRIKKVNRPNHTTS